MPCDDVPTAHASSSLWPVDEVAPDEPVREGPSELFALSRMLGRSHIQLGGMLYFVKCFEFWLCLAMTPSCLNYPYQLTIY